MSQLLEAIERSAARVIVVSPHMDDAVLSCGGLLTALGDRVRRTVVTVSTADPDPRGPARDWLASPAVRRGEDRDAIGALGCELVHLGFADAAYRFDPATGEPLYPADDAVFGAIATEDAAHAVAVEDAIRDATTGQGPAVAIGPAAIGGHVDHRICARAVVAMECWRLLYEDVPYVMAPNTTGAVPHEEPADALARLGLQGARRYSVAIDPGVKLGLIARYPTQVTMLFGDIEGARTALTAHTDDDGDPVEGYWEVPS